MKTNISIITWINRFLMIPFIGSLLAGILKYDFLYHAALIAFVLGCFQVFSFFNTALYYKRLTSLIKKYLLIYFGSVILYFVSLSLLLGVYNLFSLKIVFWMLPVLLSILWTFILETLKKEI